MEIIYVDSFFFLNLLADYLLLLCAARICALQLKRLRYFLAALLGSAYAVSVLLPHLSFLSGAGYKLLCAAAMGLIAYGCERRALGCTGVFLMLSLALGGLFMALGLNLGLMNLNLRFLVVCFLISYALVKLLFSRCSPKPDKCLVNVTLHMLGKSTSFTALADSGNCLSDPATGEKVILASPHALSGIFPQSLLAINQPVDFVSAAAVLVPKAHFRLLPYASLGGHGLVPVFSPECLLLDGKGTEGTLVGIAAQATGAGFEGIV